MISTMPPTSALLIPEVVKDFDPDQLRDDHGRWSKIGAALHAIEQAVGQVVGHETFGGDEGKSDSHGIIAAHPDGSFSLHLHDKDVGTQHVLTLSNADELEGLRAGVEEAGRAHRENPEAVGSLESDDEDVAAWQVEYTPSGVSLYANFDDGQEGDEALLSYDDLDSLESALAGASNLHYAAKFPDHTRPLLPGEETRPKSRKRLGGSDREFTGAVAVVDTPDGPRVRLGALFSDDSGGIKGWTGGRGNTTVDLDRQHAAEVADVLEKMEADGKARQKIYDKMLKDEYALEAAGQPAFGEGFDEEIENALEEAGLGSEFIQDYGSPFEQDYSTRVVQTPWGFVRLTDVGMNDEDNGHERHIKMEIWPSSMTEEEYDAGQEPTGGPRWAWPGMDDRYQKPDADLRAKDIRTLLKTLREAFDEPTTNKMALDQPRDPDGKWSKNPFGMATSVMESLEGEYGPIIDADSWSAGDQKGWVSLHDNGDYALSYENEDGTAEPFLDSAMESAYWHRLPDNLRSIADTLDDEDTDTITEGPDGDDVYGLTAYDHDGERGVSFDAGQDGFVIDDPDEVRDLADKVEWLLDRHDDWMNGEYDDPDEDDEEFEFEPDDDADDVEKAAGKGHGGKTWEEQWKHGKLAKKWIGHPHPWTALYHHLRKHMPDEMAKRTAAQWHHDVFGIWPGEKRGKNPVGPG